MAHGHDDEKKENAMMTPTRPLFVCLVLALACTSFAERPAEQPEPEVPGHLHNAGGQPWFVPESLLGVRPLEELLGRYGAAALRNQLTIQRTPHLYMVHGKSPLPLCEQITDSPVEGGPVPLSRLHELINGDGIAVIAHVTGVFPGWLDLRGVAELAELEVLEILDPADAGPVTVGSTLRVITPGGQLTYEEVVLCAPTKDVWHRPRAGERLLLIGGQEESRPAGYFVDWLRFELRGEEVILEAQRATGRVLHSLPMSQIVEGVDRLHRDVR